MQTPVLKTITCGDRRVEVTTVSHTEGTLDGLTHYEDTLCRDRRGQYYIEEKRAMYPRRDKGSRRSRDHGKTRDYQNRRTTAKPIGDKAAMLWFIENHVEDEELARLFTWQIFGNRAEESNVIVRFPVQGRLALAGGAA